MENNKSPFEQALGMTPDQFGIFVDVMYGNKSVDEAIDLQEKSAQRRACNSSRLPLRGTEDRTPWESLGIEFSEVKDALFVDVTLPDGWKFVATDHAMHSNLCDEQGRIRAKMFYKGAIYDQDASIYICNRFRINNDASAGKESSSIKGIVEDFGTPEPRTVFMTRAPKTDKYYGDREEIKAKCEAWLDERHPDWRNPAAYW